MRNKIIFTSYRYVTILFRIELSTNHGRMKIGCVSFLRDFFPSVNIPLAEERLINKAEFRILCVRTRVQRSLNRDGTWISNEIIWFVLIKIYHHRLVYFPRSDISDDEAKPDLGANGRHNCFSTVRIKDSPASNHPVCYVNEKDHAATPHGLHEHPLSLSLFIPSISV